ncbi:O-antigen ligase family protein [Bradyrhizobium diazoefficiens]|uniref:O-antigen ligase family protein n=1 Tax=Bradyrhizobium diazoefficiens TaxID=1355477 RepID=UPI00272B0C9A|nr:O-antigen ligase family protein [Bradyrhizobium diazoefficiens]WLA67667.1 O-antigen ligase family protein [Bradyrhizobium diazoefficiens]
MSRPFASSPAYKFLIVFLVAGLLFQTGALRTQLAGIDPGLNPNLPTAGPPASMMVQFLTGSIFLAVVGLLLCSRRTTEMALGTWPIFLLPVLAFVSMLWSPDPAFTLRKSIAFTGTVMFGFLIATVLNTQAAVRLLGRTLSLTILLSVIWVFLYPRYGVHNAADQIELGLTGDWRGVFSHRTALGHVAGLTIALLVFSGSLIWTSGVVRYGIMVLSVVCLIQAGSGGGFLTGAIVPCALLATQALIRLKPARSRSTVLALLLVAILPLMLLIPKLLPTLLFVLNKQPDLTGRIPLWDALLILAQEHLLLGYGYAAGFVYEIQPRVLAATGFTYAHCHNGYLEVLIAFGYLGLGICLAVVIWLLKTTGRLIVAPPPHLGHLSGLPFIVVLYTLSINCFESTLITETSYAVVLLALAAGLATRARIETRDRDALIARFRRDSHV